MPPLYACAACGAAVGVSPAGEITRECVHADAAVIAERTAVLRGEGDAADASLGERALNALCRLAAAFGVHA